VEQLVSDKHVRGIRLFKGVEVVVSLFTPILTILRLADAEEPCMGLVYSSMKDLTERVKELQLHGSNAENKVRREEVGDVVHNRWMFLHKPIYTAAYALNPAFKEAKLDQGMRDELDQVLLQFCNESDEELTELKKEFEMYKLFQGPGCDSATSVLPHVWWFAHGPRWPLLQRVAMKILAQCPSSSPSERNWSAYDFVHSKKRNRLNSNRAEKLVYVFHNVRSLRKIAAQQEGDRKKVLQETVDRLEAEALEVMGSLSDDSSEKSCSECDSGADEEEVTD
jgi:hypothetical protein